MPLPEWILLAVFSKMSGTYHHQDSYSFYLNLIVLDHVVPSKDQDASNELGNPKSPELSPSTSASTPNSSKTDIDDLESETSGNDDDQDKHHEEKNSPQTPRKADLLKKSLHGLDQSFRNNMRGWSKRSSQVATKAGAFAARKTMVSRAAQILNNKCLPELAAANKDLTIGKHFSQGRVTVLHVGLKSSAMSRYIAQVKSEESATHYSSAMSMLEALGASSTMTCLEREMLMHVRKGLMDKLSTLLLQKMNEKGNGLELECIALEESEEARWLFTFMEFQEQMKL